MLWDFVSPRGHAQAMAAPVFLVGSCGWRGMSTGGARSCRVAGRQQGRERAVACVRGFVAGPLAGPARALRCSVLGGGRCCRSTGLRQNPASAVDHWGRNVGQESSGEHAALPTAARKRPELVSSWELSRVELGQCLVGRPPGTLSSWGLLPGAVVGPLFLGGGGCGWAVAGGGAGGHKRGARATLLGGSRAPVVIPKFRRRESIQTNQKECPCGAEARVALSKRHGGSGQMLERAKLASAKCATGSKNIPVVKTTFKKGILKLGMELGGSWQVDFSEVPRQNGDGYILVRVDTFAGWPEVFPCRSNQVKEVLKYLLQELLPRIGVPIGTSWARGPHMIAEVVIRGC